MTKYNSTIVDSSEKSTNILEIEKRVDGLEEDIDDINFDINNHIHWQYEKYPTRSDEYYFERNRVRIKPKLKDFPNKA